LAASLCQNTKLHELVLGDNRISGSGAQQFAAMLKVNTGLLELVLRVNNIGGAVEGAEARGGVPTLHSLHSRTHVFIAE
jgi:hypothetical protein